MPFSIFSKMAASDGNLCKFHFFTLAGCVCLLILMIVPVICEEDTPAKDVEVSPPDHTLVEPSGSIEDTTGQDLEDDEDFTNVNIGEIYDEVQKAKLEYKEQNHGAIIDEVLKLQKEMTHDQTVGVDDSENKNKVNADITTESSSPERGDDVELNEEQVVKLNSTVENATESENSSLIVQWINFLFDPFLEEFKDGIYSKNIEKANESEINSTDVNVTETIDLVAQNITEPEFLNLTDPDSVNITDSGKKVKFQCVGRNNTDNVTATVKVITSARLLQLLSIDKNETDNVTDCLLVMFYAPWCHFCAKTAPRYNALARAFPQLDFVAVDTAQFSNLLARFGTVSVPNILVFHQSRAAVKFNQTERTFENFVSFVRNTTGLEPNGTVNVTEIDYHGPVPSIPTDDTDYLLLISWVFVIFCSSCMFVKSNKGQQWITRVRVLWQEHQHID